LVLVMKVTAVLNARSGETTLALNP